MASDRKKGSGRYLVDRFQMRLWICLPGVNTSVSLMKFDYLHLIVGAAQRESPAPHESSGLNRT
jgi:hypothetical protein